MNNFSFSCTEALAIFQGLYFFVTGVWPIIDIRSFQKVTGPKTDLWLVKTVGAMISVVGSVLLMAGYFARVSPDIFVLAVASSAALTIVDVVYVRKAVISRIYLLDAAVEIPLILIWIYCFLAV